MFTNLGRNSDALIYILILPLVWNKTSQIYVNTTVLIGWLSIQVFSLDTFHQKIEIKAIIYILIVIFRSRYKRYFSQNIQFMLLNFAT